MALVAGCSDDGGADDDQAAVATIPIEIPDVVDEVCDDVVGDVADDEFVIGSATEPAGIDLLRAEAHLDAEVVEVRWTVTGDPAAADRPRFTVTQGNPGDLTSWTLQAEQEDGAWTTTLYTTERVDDPRGVILTREVPSPLDVAPEIVDDADGGSSIVLTVPRSDLPPPATVAWLFGASALPPGGAAGPGEAAGTTTPDGAEVAEETADLVFDDCSNLFDAAG